MSAMTSAARPVGELLRDWRQRRRLSQLELSIQAEISTRHLSFVETGRSRPTPQMIVKLTEQLEVPLRERNQLLLAGGYAPAYPQHGLDAPELAAVRSAMTQVLAAHQPYPALVIDRWWTMLDANEAVGRLVEGCAAELLTPPVNVLRLSLHPDGLAPRIVNLGEWRAHLLARVRRRADVTGDERLRELLVELDEYPVDDNGDGRASATAHGVVLPMRLRQGQHELSMFTLSAAVETTSDITVQELVIESFYPADETSAVLMRQLYRV
jgi:transcriptional regulator with XRE-family HTH domain